MSQLELEFYTPSISRKLIAERKPKKERECKYCNKIFYCVVSQIKRGRGKYCSKICYDKFQQKGENIKCSICSKMFYASPSSIKLNRRFCSDKCYRINQIPNLNHDLFSSIRTEGEAYWLGFITADGYLGKTRNEIIIQLHKKDRNHLEKFKKFVNSNNKISILYRNAYRTRIFSKQIYQFLNNLGVYNNKSHTVQPCSQIPDHLLKHYWRGMIDGDGCIFHGKNGRWNLSLVGNKYMLEGFRDYINNIINIERKIRPHSTIYQICYGGKISQKIVNIIYKDSNIYLDRKMKLANKLMDKKFRGVKY